MDQEVKYIALKDLVLWTENPRDPISEDAKDQEIVDRALEDKSGKWTLKKLADEMGSRYDFSELPTVVYHGDKPVVYDGNRRIVLGKIKRDLVNVEGALKVRIPDFPKELPCNVCRQEIALDNILRKHSDSGSWQPLERDIFLHKYMNRGKSTFLILEEETGIISKHPKLNQRFVKEEVFKPENLKHLGFHFENGELLSTHSDDESKEILFDVARKIEKKEITTRKNRGNVVGVLDPSSQKIVGQNKNVTPKPANVKFKEPDGGREKKKRTQRTHKKSVELFGGPLYLQLGVVSNVYRDILDLHRFYVQEKSKLSDTFPNLIRMSLRLLCETAANENGQKLNRYLSENFQLAKDGLDKDIKTTLANQNVSQDSIIQLLQTGAHAYTSSSNMEQTIAVSIIVGSMLSLTHGRD